MNRYLREWEQRVRVLEEKVACHAQLLDDGVRTSLGQPGREGAHNGHDDGIHLEAHQLHDSALEEPSTDGMAISFVAEHDSAYFGTHLVQSLRIERGTYCDSRSVVEYCVHALFAPSNVTHSRHRESRNSDLCLTGWKGS